MGCADGGPRLDVSHPLSAWRPAEYQAAVGTLGRLRFAAEIGDRGLNMNFGCEKFGLTYRSERSIGPTGGEWLRSVRLESIYISVFYEKLSLLHNKIKPGR
jgi:hypothetical protein